MKNMFKMITGSILTLSLLVGSVAVASAFQGDPNEKGPNFSDERHAEMNEVIESGDYASFKTLLEEDERGGRLLEVVTADNFDTFVKAHNLALSGDLEGAKELREELGLGLGLKNGQGFKKGNGSGEGRGNRSGNFGNCPTQ